TLFYDVQIVPVVSAKSILPSPLALLVMYIENIRRKIDVLILRFVSFSLGCNLFLFCLFFFFFSSRRRHTRLQGDWSSDVCSSDLASRIDGAGPFRFFWDTLLPLSVTTIAALFVIQFIYGWNQYLWPLLITTQDSIGRVSCRERV